MPPLLAVRWLSSKQMNTEEMCCPVEMESKQKHLFWVILEFNGPCLYKAFTLTCSVSKLRFKHAHEHFAQLGPHNELIATNTEGRSHKTTQGAI